METKNKNTFSRRDFIQNTGMAIIGIGLSATSAFCEDFLPKSQYTPKSKQRSDQSTSCEHDNLFIIDVHRHCLPRPSSAAEGMINSIFKYQIGWEDLPAGATVN